MRKSILLEPRSAAGFILKSAHALLWSDICIQYISKEWLEVRNLNQSGKLSLLRLEPDNEKTEFPSGIAAKDYGSERGKSLEALIRTLWLLSLSSFRKELLLPLIIKMNDFRHTSLSGLFCVLVSQIYYADLE